MGWETTPPTDRQKAEVIRRAGIVIVPAWGARQIRRMITAVEMMPTSSKGASEMIQWLAEQPEAPLHADESMPNTCFAKYWERMPDYWFEMLADVGYHHPEFCKCRNCTITRITAKAAEERASVDMARREAARVEREERIAALTAREVEMRSRASGSLAYMPECVKAGTFYVFPDHTLEMPNNHEAQRYDTRANRPEPGDLIRVEYAERLGRLYGKRLTTIAQKHPTTGEVKYKGRYQGIGTLYLTYLDEAGKLTPKRAAQLGHAFGICVYCTKDLDVPESKLNGMGKSCWNQYARPYGTTWKKMDGGVIR